MTDTRALQALRDKVAGRIGRGEAMTRDQPNTRTRFRAELLYMDRRLLAILDALIGGGGGMMEWQPIETAPKDGTIFKGCSLDPARPFSERLMRWGIALRPEENYVCNGGVPWWINADGRYLAPRPTHWTPGRVGEAGE